MNEIRNTSETPITGSLLLCPALSGLGKNQRRILKLMANGHKIVFHSEFFDTLKESTDLIDEDSNEIEWLNPSILISFVRRKIVEISFKYSTVQPDTDTLHYSLKSEFVSVVLGWA